MKEYVEKKLRGFSGLPLSLKNLSPGNIAIELEGVVGSMQITREN